MEEKKLFNKDFTLVVIGQIISLFGNAIIRLAMPLYLLELTGSAALYGTALACSMIPMIILSPIGGMIADRVNKRNIMVILDFSTAGFLILFLIALKVFNAVPIVIIAMMVLYGIQALYQPTVQGSIPVLVASKDLLSANSIINQINALANLVGPTLGGVAYGIAGIWAVIGTGVVCFTVSAIMEIFITMPYIKQKAKGSILQIAKDDFKEGIQFAVGERPAIVKVALVCAAFNLILSSMVMVGVPAIIKINLALSNELYSYAQSSLGAGSLLGGICVGVFSKKLNIKKSYILLALLSLVIVPMGIGLLLNLNAMVVYGLIIIGCTAGMGLITVFSIQTFTYIQGSTPTHLIGKVVSCVMALCMCAQPIGQAIYGVLFQKMKDQPEWIVLIAATMGVILSIASRKIFKEIETNEKKAKGKKEVAQVAGM